MTQSDPALKSTKNFNQTNEVAFYSASRKAAKRQELPEA